MRVIIYFPEDWRLWSKESLILEEWIKELINDKSTENTSPLRYADRFVIDN